jgi:hypothetical protein
MWQPHRFVHLFLFIYLNHSPGNPKSNHIYGCRHTFRIPWQFRTACNLDRHRCFYGDLESLRSRSARLHRIQVFRAAYFRFSSEKICAHPNTDSNTKSFDLYKKVYRLTRNSCTWQVVKIRFLWCFVGTFSKSLWAILQYLNAWKEKIKTSRRRKLRK